MDAVAYAPVAAYVVPIVISAGAFDADVDFDVDDDPQAAANNDIAASDIETATILEPNNFTFPPSLPANRYNALATPYSTAL
jgi:hypothetical protein